MTTATMTTPEHLEFIHEFDADKRAVVCALIALHNKYSIVDPTDITGHGEWAAAYCSSLNHHPTCSSKTRTRRLTQTHQLAHRLGVGIAHANARDLAQAWDNAFND